MGWLFTHGATRADIIREIRNYAADSTYRLLRAAQRAGSDWHAVEHVPSGRRYVVQYMIAARNGAAGYKEISEDMGPVDTRCPLSVLDALGDAPPLNESSAAWRERVRTQGTTDAWRRNLRPGVAVRIVHRPEAGVCTLAQKIPHKGWTVVERPGFYYPATYLTPPSEETSQ